MSEKDGNDLVSLSGNERRIVWGWERGAVGIHCDQIFCEFLPLWQKITVFGNFKRVYSAFGKILE